MAKQTVVAAISDSARKTFRLPPDPEDMNDRRAEAAGCALDSFSSDLGELIDGKQQYTETDGKKGDLTIQNLTDLMADFGHFCDRNNIDFADILRRAQYHYDEETNNKGKQEFSAK